MKKQLRKKLRPVRHLIVYWLLLTVRFVFSILPLNFSIRIGGLLGRIFYLFAGKIKTRSLRTLDLAYGEGKPLKEKKEIIKSLFDHLGRSLVEAITFQNWSKDEFLNRISTDKYGKQFEQFRKDKGLMVITAHLGSWELFPGFFSTGLDQPVGVIARELNNPYIEQMLYQNRESQNQTVLIRGKFGRSILRHLKNEGVLGILADQDTRMGPGIFVDFFNRPSYTQLGPFQLAARSKCAVLVGFIIRQPDGFKHKVLFDQVLEINDDLDPEAQAREFTQKYTHSIEKFIDQYPEQWMWFHRRWRRQPDKDRGTENWMKGDSYITVKEN